MILMVCSGSGVERGDSSGWNLLGCQYSVWSGFPGVPISALLSVISLGGSRPVWLHGGHFVTMEVTMERSELCLKTTLGILVHFGIFILKLTFLRIIETGLGGPKLREKVNLNHPTLKLVSRTHCKYFPY